MLGFSDYRLHTNVNGHDGNAVVGVAFVVGSSAQVVRCQKYT
jgi:hypothetical protein